MNRERAVKILCLMLACCMAKSSVATEPKDSKNLPPADAKQQVLDLGKVWVNAEVKRDAATLRRILDDKFVASFGTEKPYDKEAFIKLLTTSDDFIESETLTDETVIVDHDTAVVVGTDTVRGKEKGTAYTVVYRYTVTYVRRNGQWLALAEHIVEVPQAK
jgi:ketosteroid isomerase-like protein